MGPGKIIRFREDDMLEVNLNWKLGDTNPVKLIIHKNQVDHISRRKEVLDDIIAETEIDNLFEYSDSDSGLESEVESEIDVEAESEIDVEAESEIDVEAESEIDVESEVDADVEVEYYKPNHNLELLPISNITGTFSTATLYFLGGLYAMTFYMGVVSLLQKTLC